MGEIEKMEQSEFCKWINEYHERFGESFPVMVFYGRDEIVIDKIKKCLSNDKKFDAKAEGVAINPSKDGIVV